MTSVDNLIITVGCDSSVSHPSNPNCPAPTRANTELIAQEYIRCTDAGALLSMVIGLGGHVRVGAEDNPYLSPGELADSNARLVEKFVRIASEQGRAIATPSEARETIGLEPR